MKVLYISGKYRAQEWNLIYKILLYPIWLIYKYISISINIYKARKVAIKYWKLGYVSICPHMNTAHMDNHCEAQVFLDGDIAILKRCDIIVMMKDWEYSEGAYKERTVAKRYNLEIIYE